MDIIWLGHSCFQLRGREATLILDPPSPESGYVLGPLTANIVTVSHDHPGHNNVAAVPKARKVLSGPGEYEVAGVLIEGVRTNHDAEGGRSLGRNTAYIIAIDGVRVCHLGDLGHVPTAAQVQALGTVDVLMVPVGGGTALASAAAVEAIALLAPRLVVPMHYLTPASDAALDPVEKFLREMGLSDLEPQSRLTVTPTNLPLETRVVLLELRPGG